MPDELRAALERAADLNAQAIRLVGAEPESPGRAVLASALRENRDALVHAVAAALAALLEEAEALAAARAGREDPAPVPLRLVVNG